jgi:hypothetical protein
MYDAMRSDQICDVQQGVENMLRAKEFKSVLSLL